VLVPPGGSPGSSWGLLILILSLDDLFPHTRQKRREKGRLQGRYGTTSSYLAMWHSPLRVIDQIARRPDSCRDSAPPFGNQRNQGNSLFRAKRRPPRCWNLALSVTCSNQFSAPAVPGKRGRHPQPTSALTPKGKKPSMSCQFTVFRQRRHFGLPSNPVRPQSVVPTRPHPVHADSLRLTLDTTRISFGGTADPACVLRSSLRDRAETSLNWSPELEFLECTFSI